MWLVWIYILNIFYRNLEEALEMGMDWSLREGQYDIHVCMSV